MVSVPEAVAVNEPPSPDSDVTTVELPEESKENPDGSVSTILLSAGIIFVGVKTRSTSPETPAISDLGTTEVELIVKQGLVKKVLSVDVPIPLEFIKKACI